MVVIVGGANSVRSCREGNGLKAKELYHMNVRESDIM